jgi:predicted lipoprotein with Yx(FWY)xxD motif
MFHGAPPVFFSHTHCASSLEEAMNPMRRTGVTAAAFLVVGLALAACGSSTKTTIPTITTVAPAAASVKTATSSLGTIVVDAAGRTLYRFDHDTVGAATSACTGNCALTWPPDTVTGTPSAAAGVTGVLGVITRSDGGRQLTIDGHPVYHYSGDSAAGDTNGNGIGGIWHVVSATPAAAGGGSSSTAGSPYTY